jgi:hypothetical protein
MHMYICSYPMISDANMHDETRLLGTADGGHLLTDTHTHTHTNININAYCIHIIHTHLYSWVQVDGGLHVLGARLSGRRGRYDAGVMLREDDLEDHFISTALAARETKLCATQLRDPREPVKRVTLTDGVTSLKLSIVDRQLSWPRVDSEEGRSFVMSEADTYMPNFQASLFWNY